MTRARHRGSPNHSAAPHPLRRQLVLLGLCSVAISGFAGGARVCGTGFPACHSTDWKVGPTDTRPGAKVHAFAPGVRIDWEHLVVEVDAAVTLREGMLELLACSPQTREHESILVVKTRPMHIFQAMGLIGLRPGSPIRYDEKRRRWTKATGQALRLDLRYRDRDLESTAPVERWLLDVRRGKTPEPLDWVFAGSRRLSDGRFGADVDGTIVTIVDFDAALITPATRHSADNELLGLAAHTAAIPPVGTPCVLLIRAADDRATVVAVSVDGTLRVRGKLISVIEVARIHRAGTTDASPLPVVLAADAAVPKETLNKVVESLVEAGVDRSSITAGRN